VRDRSAALNRLRAVLDLAFPELLGLLRPLESRTVLELLVAYPTAAAIAAADPGDLAQRLRAPGRRRVSPDQLQALCATAQTSIATRQAPLGLAHRVRMLARRVSELSAEIAELQAAIEQTFAALGHRAHDFPIGAAVSLGTIVAEAGEITRYASAKHFVAHFGWCPADLQSGRYKDAHPTLSKAGNRFVRRVIWMLAILAVRHPGPYRTYFDRRTAAGKNKMDTLVAIGRKLLTTMYAILKTGRPYDPLYQHPSAPALSTAA
jgi:transposase